MIGKQGVSLLIGHNGVQDKTTLSLANETVARGIYDATTLSAVDTDLATANIKNGITIFGFAGSADVFDISDATAVEAEVLDPETFYAVGGGIRTGTMPTVAVAPGSSAYPAGYHAGDVGGLPAIETDLVTGNIKQGITIFNVAGHNDVRNISDGDLVEAEAPTGKFFYAVSGGKRTGSGTKTLSDLNDTVAAGYYAATTLSAVDAHLAAANILSGVTIFGFTGPATVQDIADADALVGDVKDPKTFYSVTGARKTGTMATVALAAADNLYPAGYHAGEASLTAVDADLAAGNIKDGVEIFGVTGTVVEGALAEDVTGYDTSDVVTLTSGSHYSGYFLISNGGFETTLATKTLVFDTNSMAFATAWLNARAGAADRLYLRLYMGGVLMGTSAAIDSTHSLNYVERGFKVLSGSQICSAVIVVNAGAQVSLYFFGYSSGSKRPVGVSVGSVKLA